MILTGQLLLTDGDNRCRLSPGYLRIDEAKISELVEGEVASDADIGDPATLIAPGFIDAHLHLPQFDIIGGHGLPLLEWLDRYVYPAEMRWSEPEFAAAMTSRAAAQLLSVGTTSVAAFATVHHEAARAAIEVLRSVGIGGVVGQVLMNRQAPPELCRQESQLIDEANALAQLYPASSRLAAAITPRFAISCTESLLKAAGQIAGDHQLLLQTHLAETVAECNTVQRLFDARSYLEVYGGAGLLGQRSLLAHGVHLNDEDCEVLRQTSSVVVHCPTANTFLGSGTMDRRRLIDHGVGVAVGSDIGAGYERSMVRVAREMILAASSRGGEFPDAATAWYAITAGNAGLLGYRDAGRIEQGASADLLVIEPDVPWLPGTNRLRTDCDPLSLLMFAWDDRWIKRTMLQGRFRWGGDSP